MKIIHPLWRTGVWLERRGELVLNWHRYYAWLPVVVPEQDHEGVKVPCHYVWLEYTDRKIHADWCDHPLLILPFLQLLTIFFPGIKWRYRPYTGTEPLCVNSTLQHS